RASRGSALDDHPVTGQRLGWTVGRSRHDRLGGGALTRDLLGSGKLVIGRAAGSASSTSTSAPRATSGPATTGTRASSWPSRGWTCVDPGEDRPRSSVDAARLRRLLTLGERLHHVDALLHVVFFDELRDAVLAVLAQRRLRIDV